MFYVVESLKTPESSKIMLKFIIYKAYFTELFYVQCYADNSYSYNLISRTECSKFPFFHFHFFKFA